MNEFSQKIEEILEVIAEEYKMKLSKDTHYDSINRELSWLHKKVRKRIDFTLFEDYIDVTFYDDTLFPYGTKVLLWLYKHIPEVVPYPAVKGKWETIDKLPLEETKDFYYEKIKTYVEYVSKTKIK